MYPDSLLAVAANGAATRIDPANPALSARSRDRPQLRLADTRTPPSESYVSVDAHIAQRTSDAV